MLRTGQDIVRHLAGDGREVIKELIQSVVSLQILEQRPHRNPAVFKHGSAAEDIGIDGD
jgi:hypothetical protein